MYVFVFGGLALDSPEGARVGRGLGRELDACDFDDDLEAGFLEGGLQVDGVGVVGGGVVGMLG